MQCEEWNIEQKLATISEIQEDWIYYCNSILRSSVKIIAATHKKSALSRSHNGIFAENQHISL